jgi:hypothetical protein
MVILKRSSRIPEKECSIYLTINEMQKEMTLTFHLTPVRIAFINSTHNNRCWKRCWGKGMFIHHWWVCKQYNPYGKAV